MAGELPVDLRTSRKGEGQGRGAPPAGVVSPRDSRGPSLEVEASWSTRAPLTPKPSGELEGLGQPGSGAVLPGTQTVASPQEGLEGEKKAETSLPLRKRRYYPVQGADEDTQGPLAGKVPKTESGEGEMGLWGTHFKGYCSPYVSVTYPRVPTTGCYPGLAGSFLTPELSPMLHPMAPHPLLGVPTPYSLICPLQAQLALDIATATKQDEDGDTPLHIAVVQGNLLAARHLVALFHQGQRDLDIFNNLRQTPLHLAVITAQPTLVKLLLSHGASPMVLDRNGQTALHLACEHGSLHCLRELLEGSPSPLDLEARNFEGFTPLHVAVAISNHDIILTLLDRGADVDAVDIKSGRSPLLHAVENNNLEMVELLLQHGANVNAQSYGGNTALHAASGRGLLDALRLLVRNGADGSLKNYHNDTPLMVARNKRVIDILRGKASRSGPPPDSLLEGSSPATSTASSPGIRLSHTSLLRASPDSCPTTPSPAQTPKPQKLAPSPNSAIQKSETLTNGPSVLSPLHGVKLERSPSPLASEQPMGFLGQPKFFLPLGESMANSAFHALYPFATPGHNPSIHPLQLLPIGLNHSVVPLTAASLASRVPLRVAGMDPSQTLLDSAIPPTTDHEGQWPHSRENGPGGS
ncbi:B-cell lymphoma 3 protein [Tiliqua scincoides]|uniref:B-cell lymphoma 3 protein n=1 Tax=Tiliqua scincoides TaxID=71010 RepID=UPI0034617FF4